MTPRQVRQELVNAYEGHDRHAFDQALNRMESMLAYAGPHDAQGDPAPGCTRRAGQCECASEAQRRVCMYRRRA